MYIFSLGPANGAFLMYVFPCLYLSILGTLVATPSAPAYARPSSNSFRSERYMNQNQEIVSTIGTGNRAEIALSDPSGGIKPGSNRALRGSDEDDEDDEDENSSDDDSETVADKLKPSRPPGSPPSSSPRKASVDRALQGFGNINLNPSTVKPLSAGAGLGGGGGMFSGAPNLLNTSAAFRGGNGEGATLPRPPSFMRSMLTAGMPGLGGAPPVGLGGGAAPTVGLGGGLNSPSFSIQFPYNN